MTSVIQLHFSPYRTKFPFNSGSTLSLMLSQGVFPWNCHLWLAHRDMIKRKTKNYNNNYTIAVIIILPQNQKPMIDTVWVYVMLHLIIVLLTIWGAMLTFDGPSVFGKSCFPTATDCGWTVTKDKTPERNVQNPFYHSFLAWKKTLQTSHKLCRYI